jgi:hypothetical protein
MSKLRWILAVALLGTVAAPAAAGDKNGPKGGKTYETPQAVFDAAREAAKKEDWKAFCACLTPESRDMLAGLVVFAGGVMKAGINAAAEKEDKDKKELILQVVKALLKPVTDAYARHGITEATLDKLSNPEQFFKDKKDPTQVKKTLLKAAAPVKDRTAFISDVMGALTKLLQTFGKGEEVSLGGTIFPKDGRLEDLKVEGDGAKAMMIGTKKGQEKREPINFKKDRGRWRIEIPLDLPGAGKARGGQPERKEPGGRTGAIPRAAAQQIVTARAAHGPLASPRAILSSGLASE